MMTIGSLVLAEPRVAAGPIPAVVVPNLVAVEACLEAGPIPVVAVAHHRVAPSPAAESVHRLA